MTDFNLTILGKGTFPNSGSDRFELPTKTDCIEKLQNLSDSINKEVLN
ncbi:MAG: hypothetical protein MJK05_09590 [Nitrosopumilus sp.]|nr:hypothetical protein [Nitrosopumilus sp.]